MEFAKQCVRAKEYAGRTEHINFSQDDLTKNLTKGLKPGRKEKLEGPKSKSNSRLYKDQ